jgi:hypothetical protein
MNSKSMCRAWLFGPVLSLSVALASCSGPVPMGTNTPGGSGNGSGSGAGAGGSGNGSNINLDPGATSTSVSTGTDVNDKQNCGVTTNDANKQPVDLLLILDRSGSMTRAMDTDDECAAPRAGRTATCQQRWATMKTALAQVLSTSAGTVKWGLKLYSTPKQDACAVSGDVEVPIAAGNASQITTAINNAQNAPDMGRTPTRDAVNKGVAYLKTVSGPETKSILLATDGQPNCMEGNTDTAAGDETATTAAIQSARDAGFKVYILGIGPDKFTAALNGFALAGGTDKTDVGGSGKNYYAALSAEEMAKQFDSIVGSVASCTFSLKSVPPVVDNIAVEFDGDKSLRAPRDTTHTNGWDYPTPGNYTTVQLYGEWCDKLTNGTYKAAKVLFGCKGQIIP